MLAGSARFKKLESFGKKNITVAPFFKYKYSKKGRDMSGSLGSSVLWGFCAGGAFFNKDFSSDVSQKFLSFFEEKEVTCSEALTVPGLSAKKLVQSFNLSEFRKYWLTVHPVADRELIQQFVFCALYYQEPWAYGVIFNKVQFKSDAEEPGVFAKFAKKLLKKVLEMPLSGTQIHFFKPVMSLTEYGIREDLSWGRIPLRDREPNYRLFEPVASQAHVIAACRDDTYDWEDDLERDAWHQKDKRGNTTLHYAILGGKLMFAHDLVLMSEVDKHHQNQQGLSAITMAILLNKRELLAGLANAGQDLETIVPQLNKRKLSLLHLAAEYLGDSFELINYFIPRYSFDFLNFQNDKGETTLHILIRKGFYETVNQLFKADINRELDFSLKNQDGKNILTLLKEHVPLRETALGSELMSLINPVDLPQVSPSAFSSVAAASAPVPVTYSEDQYQVVVKKLAEVSARLSEKELEVAGLAESLCSQGKMFKSLEPVRKQNAKLQSDLSALQKDLAEKVSSLQTQIKQVQHESVISLEGLKSVHGETIHALKTAQAQELEQLEQRLALVQTQKEQEKEAQLAQLKQALEQKIVLVEQEKAGLIQALELSSQKLRVLEGERSVVGETEDVVGVKSSLLALTQEIQRMNQTLEKLQKENAELKTELQASNLKLQESNQMIEREVFAARQDFAVHSGDTVYPARPSLLAGQTQTVFAPPSPGVPVGYGYAPPPGAYPGGYPAFSFARPPYFAGAPMSQRPYYASREFF